MLQHGPSGCEFGGSRLPCGWSDRGGPFSVMSEASSHNQLRLAFAAAFAALLIFVLAPAPARALTMPAPEFKPPDISGVVKLAQAQFTRRVSENRSNNVPRFRNGRGRVAPYSIGDQWCAAFATWVWNRNGFDDYKGAKYLRRSRDGTEVAIQVRDLTQWAVQNRYFSYAAMPGFLVVYGPRHIGIVRNVNRKGRAVLLDRRQQAGPGPDRAHRHGRRNRLHQPVQDIPRTQGQQVLGPRRRRLIALLGDTARYPT